MFGGLANRSPSQWLKKGARYPAWILVGLVVLVVMGIRVRLRDMPLERDEGEYAYMGQLMLQGVPPYKEACNMKLPGTYAAYALSMAAFGQSPAGIHLGVMLVNAASIVLIFLIGRKLLDDTAGAVAAISYGLLSLSPSVVGPSAHATHFVVLPALAGTLLLARAPSVEGRGMRALVLAGVLFGLAFLMKQHGIFFGVFGALYLVGMRIEQWIQARAESKFPSRRSIPSKVAQSREPSLSSTRPSTGNPQPASAPQRLSHFAAGKLAKKAASDEGRAATENSGGLTDGPNPKSENAQPLTNVPDAERTPYIRALASGDQKPSDQITRFEVQSSKLEDQNSSASRDPQAAMANSAASRAARPSTSSPRPTVLLIDLAVFAVGAALPYVVTCLLLWWAGVFSDFVFWTISYARKYTAIISAGQGVDMLRSMLGVAVGYNFLLWLLPWFGALLMWWDEGLTTRAGRGIWSMERRRTLDGGEIQNPKAEVRTLKPELAGMAVVTSRPRASGLPSARLFLTLFLLCSLGSVSVGLYFRLHYFITLLPALALLSGVAVSRSLFVVKNDRTIELFLAVPVLILFVLAVGAALIGNGSVWLGMSPTQAAQEVHGTELFAEAVKVADYLKANTAKDARIAVVGSEPELFFYSHRRSASKYLYVYPLMEPQPFARRMQEEMIQEIERARPEYVVYADDWTSWLRQANSEPLLDKWWQQYWPANLDLVQQVPFAIARPPENLPGMRDREEEEGKQAMSGQLLVYRRRAGPSK